MKKTLLILVVLMVLFVNVGPVSAASMPPETERVKTGWIGFIDNVDQRITVGTKICAWVGCYWFWLYVTDSTQIKIAGESDDFGDLEPGQYITYSFYREDGIRYATRISATNSPQPDPSP
jgi:hypothetical protein